MHNPGECLARWSIKIQSYDFEVEHHKGSLNLAPDALSRMFEEENPAVSLASMEITDETTDASHRRTHNQVRDAPTEHP